MEIPDKRRKSLTLLAAASDAIRRETAETLQEFLQGGTWGDAELLGTIYYEHDGTVRPSELVGLAYTTSAGVTGSLRRLEAAGFVERRRTEEDRRSLLVVLTDLGREKFEAVIPSFQALADERLGDLSDDDVNWLFDFLKDQFDS